jgi:glutathione S-transferase
VITIYGMLESGNSLKVRWVAERLGISFSWIETDIWKGQSRTPEFLAINPAGQVPVVILSDGRVLAQSNAIILHLARGSDLSPTDDYDQSKMLEWLFWEQYSHEPSIAVRIARLHFMRVPEAEIEPSLLSRGHAALARMERRLQEAAYLVGDRLTLADVALFAYTHKATLGGFDLERYPATCAWVDRVRNDLKL